MALAPAKPAAAAKPKAAVKPKPAAPPPPPESDKDSDDEMMGMSLTERLAARGVAAGPRIARAAAAKASANFVDLAGSDDEGGSGDETASDDEGSEESVRPQDRGSTAII